MKFINKDISLTLEQIIKEENKLPIRFPKVLKKLFLENNGGEPEPYAFQSDFVNTLIQGTLPLISGTGRATAIEVYDYLVIQKGLLSKRFFPFAFDPGGDYFFIDCISENSQIIIYRHDTAFEPLVELEIGLDTFWNTLTEEE